MNTTVHCPCGKGVLAIEVTLFGVCPACGSGDIQKAELTLISKKPAI